MLNLPEYKVTSVLVFARIIRKYNPMLDLSSSRRTARLILQGKYVKQSRKIKFESEFQRAIEILKEDRISKACD